MSSRTRPRRHLIRPALATSAGLEARRPSRLVSVLVAAAALAMACGPRVGEREGNALALADFVIHQKANVSTRLISVPEGIGLDRLEGSWELVPGDGVGEEWSAAEISSRSAELRLYSALGDLRALELDLSLSPVSPVGRRGMRIQLNGRNAGRLRVTRRWTSHRLNLPGEHVRIGDNVISLRPVGRPRARRGRPAPIRLRGVRVVMRSARPPWGGRREEIRVRGAHGATGSKIVELPTASCLDVVLRVPEGGRLTGAVSVERPSSPDANPSGTVEASVRLLDEHRAESRVFHTTLTASSGLLPLDRGLQSWAGQLVRLRFSAGGPGNAVVGWHDAGVQGETSVTEPSPGLPIAPAPVAPSHRLGRPDVLVVLLDAGRGDAFSPIGGPHQTPAAERLAAGGTVFRQAVAPSSWTGQSVPALLTGLFPDTVGVGVWNSRLPDGIPTLAELMAAAGYRTTLWSQHPMYGWQGCFVRGFEEVHVSPASAGFERLPNEEDLLSEARPTFAFVHLVPPHTPYTPPAPFLGLYTGWHEGAAISTSLSELQRPPEETRSPVALRFIQDRYLENVAFADHLLGQVLTVLDGRDRYRDALVVLLSDHGEAFYEHQRFLHGEDVHRESLHVPLIVKWPSGVEGFLPSVDQPVSLVDLVPTLVDGLALPTESGFQGRSLLPLCFDGKRRTRALYAMTRGHSSPNVPERPQLMLETGGWRILHRPLLDQTELYRVDSDPRESRDLALEFPLRALLLRQEVLRQWTYDLDLQANGERPPAELEPEEVEQLEALGYVF